MIDLTSIAALVAGGLTGWDLLEAPALLSGIFDLYRGVGHARQILQRVKADMEKAQARTLGVCLSNVRAEPGRGE